MSTWSDKFEAHPFLGVWKTLLDLSHEDALTEDLNEDSIQDIARIKKVVSYIDGIIKNIDPELFPFNLLNNLQNQTQACFNELNAFKGNKNVAHIQNANTQIDTIITIFNQTPASLYSISTENIKEATSAYGETINSYINKYKENTDNGITDLNNRVTELNETISEKEEKLVALESELKTVEQTIQQQTTEFNTQYQANEKTWNDKFDKLFEQHTNKADKEFEELTTKSSKIIEILVKLQDDAAKVYGVTINTLQAGAYSSYANEEKGTANWLRILASILMLIGVGFLVVPELLQILDKTIEYKLDWKKVLGRVPLSLILFVPAFYFAKESGKHRNNEVANRRRQHILTTLDPYIELMDPEKAEDLKIHVAKTIFSEASSSRDDDDKETSNIISQLANLAKQIKGK